MFLKYYNLIINNNLWLSLAVSCLVTIIYYCENRRTKTKYNNIDYFKQFCLISLAIYFVLYIKNKEIIVKESNIKMGDPDF